MNHFSTHDGARVAAARPSGRGGFTLIEIMFAVLILALLLSLLIVGVRRASRTVKDTVDRQTVHAIAMAVSDFKKEFKFNPPMVQEMPGTAGMLRLVRMAPTGAVNQILVYDLGRPADLVALQGAATPDPTNPFGDELRYSTSSLAIYLAGAFEVPYSSTATFIPMDGVKGPGFYEPRRDGTFKVPVELTSSSANASKRGTPHAPLVQLGGSAPRLIIRDTEAKELALVDRNGTPIRYYRWEPKVSATPDLLADLRVPPMVGRDPTGFPINGTRSDRDLTANTQLRSAKFAIVAAGNNKLFGDETIAELKLGLANNADSDDELRRLAEEDNIVEVGQ